MALGDEMGLKEQKKTKKQKTSQRANSLQPLGWCGKVEIYNNFMSIINMNDI